MTGNMTNSFRVATGHISTYQEPRLVIPEIGQNGGDRIREIASTVQGKSGYVSTYINTPTRAPQFASIYAQRMPSPAQHNLCLALGTGVTSVPNVIV